MEKLHAVHGTSKACAQVIQNTGFKKGASGYWRAGVYFFEKKNAGIAHALNWARSRAGMRSNCAQHSQDCVALLAYLECQKNFYLDFSSDALNGVLRKLRSETRNKFLGHSYEFQEQMIKKCCLTFLSDIEKQLECKIQILKAPVPLADPDSGMGFCIVVYDEKCISKPPYEVCYE